MFLDNLRSVVHKSLRKTLLVGCENGNEIVECGMMRKSKISSFAVDCQRANRGPDLISLGGKEEEEEEEEEAMAYQKRTELQLLEVSRGSRELTHMIDSWSKVPNLNRRSKDIAEDIVRGALDLQESLIMLERLQEVTRTMSQMKDRGKSGFMEEKGPVEGGEIDAQFMGSTRFEISGYSNRLRGQSRCHGQSSRSRRKKSKNVTRDRLYRQNLWPISSDDERASSHSLGYSATRSGLMDACSDGKGKTKSSEPIKVRAPNLIAKLMGLDEVPPAAVHPIKREHKSEQILNPPRLMEQNPNPKRETTPQNIIEAVKSKGLMKSDPHKDSRFQSSSSGTSQSELHGRTPCTDGAVPPIASMKASHGRAQKDPLPTHISAQKKARSVKLEQQEIVADNGPLLSRKSERNKGKILERKKVEASQRTKSLDSLSHKQQREEPVKALKKTYYEGEKPQLNRMNDGEKKDVKVAATPLSQAKTATRTPSKPPKRLAAARSASRPVNVPRNSTPRPISQNSTTLATDNKTTRVKRAAKSNSIKATTPKNREYGKETNPSCQTDDASTSSILPADGPPKQDGETKSCNKDHIRKDCKVICEVMPKASKGGRSSGTTEAAAVQVPSSNTATRRADGVEDELEKLLLSSQSFIDHAEELFGFHARRSLYEPRNGLKDFGARNEKLYLGCARELMTHKVKQIELLNHPLSKTLLCCPSVYASLEQLVREIGSGISKLNKYGELGDDVSSKDCLYIRLERDLRCKEMLLDAMWDIGWGNKICLEQADQVVVLMGDLILYGLVEEVAVDLWI